MSKNPERYENDAQYYVCPACRRPLRLKRESLRCEGGHCYEISKDGFVNLGGKAKAKAAQDQNPDVLYDRLFIMEQGIYRPVVDEIISILRRRCGRGAYVLDAGCAEGYVANEVYALTDANVFALDASRDSVRFGAQDDTDGGVQWIVGDPAHLPFKDSTMDCVLNVLSSGDYGEFARVLGRRGFVVRVVAGPNHLVQLREKAQGQLRRRRYSNQRVVDRFAELFNCVSSTKVTYDCELSPEERDAFAAMAPMLFNVENGMVEWGEDAVVTIDVEVQVGEKKRR